MILEQRARRLAASWLRMAKTHKLALDEQRKGSAEWRVNQAWAEALERCAEDLSRDLARHGRPSD